MNANAETGKRNCRQGKDGQENYRQDNCGQGNCGGLRGGAIHSIARNSFASPVHVSVIVG